MAGAYQSDIVLVRTGPGIRLLAGQSPWSTDAEEAQGHLQGAREFSLSMIYWMQTEGPRADEGPVGAAYASAGYHRHH